MTSPALALPKVRGDLAHDAQLAPYSWFRVGGPADALFLPADDDDLADFLAALPGRLPVTALGVGSNVIIRDGGIDGVAVRLAGRHWGRVEVLGEDRIYAGAGALDVAIAKTAAASGILGLEFLSGVPGSIGGALRTNAGCYGRELKDVVERVDTVARSGERRAYQGPLLDQGLARIAFSYRHSDLPEDEIVTGRVLRGSGAGDPAAIRAEIEALQTRRAESQPIREKTGGSTFANPDPPGTPNQRSAWRLIDAAGCRGLRVGGAQVSEKHCNFLINANHATAADLEALGELVRARVRATSGVDLRWEIRRIGRLQAP